MGGLRDQLSPLYRRVFSKRGSLQRLKVTWEHTKHRERGLLGISLQSLKICRKKAHSREQIHSIEKLKAAC